MCNLMPSRILLLKKEKPSSRKKVCSGDQSVTARYALSEDMLEILKSKTGAGLQEGLEIPQLTTARKDNTT